MEATPVMLERLRFLRGQSVYLIKVCNPTQLLKLLSISLIITQLPFFLLIAIFLSFSQKINTNTATEMEPLTRVESRPFEHKYFIRQPRDARVPSQDAMELREALVDGNSKDNTTFATNSRVDIDSVTENQEENVEALKGILPRSLPEVD